MDVWSLYKDDQGVVFKKNISGYTVTFQGKQLSCTLDAHLYQPAAAPLPGDKRQKNRRLSEKKSIEPVVGDRVKLGRIYDGQAVITEVLPRHNQLSRRSAVPMPTAQAYEQVIAANVDQIVPVFAAADPPPKWNMLDRYLVSAESANIPALICMTKLDLLAPGGKLALELDEALQDYRTAGYTVIESSARTGLGLVELKDALQGRLSVFLGKSGVGKTSLLNELQPGLGLRVNEVSQVTGKGKHTTTHLELFPLEFGGAIIDTPGVREFGLWDVDEDDMALYFPEMRPFIGKCRFGLNCRHDEEPDCAVRKAVMTGMISPRRYNSYLRLRVGA